MMHQMVGFQAPYRAPKDVAGGDQTPTVDLPVSLACQPNFILVSVNELYSMTQTNRTEKLLHAHDDCVQNRLSQIDII